MTNTYFNEYKKFNKHDLTATFAQVCHDGNLEAVSCIIENQQLLGKVDNAYHEMALNFACRMGHLEIVKKFQTNWSKLSASAVLACEAACIANQKHIVEIFLEWEHVQLNLDNLLQKSFDCGRHEIVKLILTSEPVKQAVKTNLMGTGYSEYNSVVVSGKLFDMDELLIRACQRGELSMAKLLLLDKDIPKNADINFLNNRALTVACENGHIDIVKFLLTDSNLKEKADINDGVGQALINATRNGSLELIQYLTTSPELKEHSDIHVQDDFIFTIALKKERVDIAHFLLTDPNLKSHIDITKNISSIYDAHYSRIDDYDDDYKHKVLAYIVADYKYIAPDPKNDLFFIQILKSVPELNKLYEVNKLANELNEEFTNEPEKRQNKRLKI
jgi:hypothetical protein